MVAITNAGTGGCILPLHNHKKCHLCQLLGYAGMISVQAAACSQNLVLRVGDEL